MAISIEILTEYMKKAMEQPIGLVIQVTNPKRFAEVELFKVGRLFPDLMICTPSLEDTIFIVHKSVELDP